ncbi:MAG: flagellar hook-length control protein FliK, partial [Pirellulales bacterium]|nr:flagellar hook-length control protein FliK [Pirellulales bacterium]
AAAAAAAAAAGDEAAKAVAAAAGAAAGAGLREAGGLQADASTALESDAPPGESLDAPVDEETAQQDDKQAAGPARPHAASESTAADGKQASAERPGKKKPAPTEQSPADPEPLAAENAPHDKHVDGRAIPQQEPAGQQQSAGERPQPDSEAQPSTTAARDARGDAGKEASARASAAAAEAIKIPPADAAAPALAETPPAAPTDSTATPPAHDKAVSTLERLAAHRLRGAERRHDPDAGPSIDRARFVQRVEGAVRAAHQRDGTIQVRLSPPELGNLRIELALHHGVMTAKLEVETPAVRNALLDSLPQLRERLAQQDIRVEKFDVDVRRDFNGSAGQRGPFDRPDSQPRQPRPDGRMPAGRPRSAGLPGGRAAAGATASDAALDIRI